MTKTIWQTLFRKGRCVIGSNDHQHYCRVRVEEFLSWSCGGQVLVYTLKRGRQTFRVPVSGSEKLSSSTFDEFYDILVFILRKISAGRSPPVA